MHNAQFTIMNKRTEDFIFLMILWDYVLMFVFLGEAVWSEKRQENRRNLIVLLFSCLYVCPYVIRSRLAGDLDGLGVAVDVARGDDDEAPGCFSKRECGGGAVGRGRGYEGAVDVIGFDRTQTCGS